MEEGREEGRGKQGGRREGIRVKKQNSALKLHALPMFLSWGYQPAEGRRLKED